MKQTIFLWIALLGCAMLHAQSPGFLGHRNVFALSTSTTINQDLKPVTTPMLSWERLTARDHSLGFSLEWQRTILYDRKLSAFNHLYQHGRVDTQSGGVGFFFKSYFFKLHRMLPPMGPYWRWDVQLWGAPSVYRSSSEDTLAPVDHRNVFVDAVLYPSASIALGSSAVVKLRFVLDFGLRFKLVLPTAISVDGTPGMSSYSATNFEALRNLDLLKFYIGLGFLK